MDKLRHLRRYMGQLLCEGCAIGGKIRLDHSVVGIVGARFFQPGLPIRQGLLILVHLENKLLYLLFLAVAKRFERMQKCIPFPARRQGEPIVEHILQRGGTQHQPGRLIQQAEQRVQIHQIKVTPRQLDAKRVDGADIGAVYQQRLAAQVARRFGRTVISACLLYTSRCV